MHLVQVRVWKIGFKMGKDNNLLSCIKTLIISITLMISCPYWCLIESKDEVQLSNTACAGAPGEDPFLWRIWYAVGAEVTYSVGKEVALIVMSDIGGPLFRWLSVLVCRSSRHLVIFQWVVRLCCAWLKQFFWDYFAAFIAYTCSALDMLEDQICRIIIGVIWKQSKQHKSISLSGQYLYQTAFSSNIALNIHSLMHPLPLLFIFFIIIIFYFVLFPLFHSSGCSRYMVLLLSSKCGKHGKWYFLPHCSWTFHMKNGGQRAEKQRIVWAMVTKHCENG